MILQVGKLNSPFPIRREEDGRHFTYLDTAGTPVVAIRNVGPLTEKHIQDFSLEFTFARYIFITEFLYSQSNEVY